MVITELVTNGLVHGTGEELVVRFLLTRRRLLIEVSDGSPGRAEVRAAGSGDESGRGMLLVDALTDGWGTSADGTTTWCSFTLPRGRP
ncbi:ATP-binding protein [Streptomyces sp. NPDC004539]|uniref:ATP-binding protein n=1 Tax=Streptomyces sp. NPDC004539 TaxID=3154280 RepID=UPI0033A5EA77